MIILILIFVDYQSFFIGIRIEWMQVNKDIRCSLILDNNDNEMILMLMISE